MKQRKTRSGKKYQVEDLIRIHQYNFFFEKIIAKLIGEYGLTYNQLLVLLIVGRSSKAQINEIAFAFGGAQSNVSSLCKDLENKGMMTRCREKSDERRVIATLTASGESIYSEVNHYLQKKITQNYLLENEHEINQWFSK